MKHRVRVGPLPIWLAADRLLGEGAWEYATHSEHVHATTELDGRAAADLAARLRGVVLAGQRIGIEVTPPLSRPAVRAGRLDEARRQRERSPGFTRAGAQLDAGTRLGLTPEDLALELGRLANKARVIDACCGAGGNAIGFARAGCPVTAIEIDARRLSMAQHNAAIYGVADRIEWLHGDARELLPDLGAGGAGLWFIDVPWQGALDASAADGAPPDSKRALLDELLALRPAGQRAWAKVPASFDPALVAGAKPRACFGVGAGDMRRVKLLILEIDA